MGVFASVISSFSETQSTMFLDACKDTKRNTFLKNNGEKDDLFLKEPPSLCLVILSITRITENKMEPRNLIRRTLYQSTRLFCCSHLLHYFQKNPI